MWLHSYCLKRTTLYAPTVMTMIIAMMNPVCNNRRCRLYEALTASVTMLSVLLRLRQASALALGLMSGAFPCSCLTPMAILPRRRARSMML